MRIICKEYSYGVNAEIILTFEDFTEMKAITLVTQNTLSIVWMSHTDTLLRFLLLNFK